MKIIKLNIKNKFRIFWSNKISRFISLMFIVTVGLGGSFLVGYNSNINSVQSEGKESKDSQISQDNTTSGSSWGIYQTRIRYFDPKDYFITDVSYPSVLSNIENTSLINLSCTPLYTGFGDKYIYNDDYTNSHPLRDRDAIKYIDLLSKKYEGQFVTEMIACTPSESSKTIILYSLGPCGGGCSGLPYVGIYDGTEIKEVSEIGSNTAYFGCRQPLMYTKNDEFYFQCGGGDGCCGSSSIYRLSADDSKITKIKQCSTVYDETTDEIDTKCD